MADALLVNSRLTLTPVEVAFGPPLAFTSDPHITRKWPPRKYVQPQIEGQSTTVDLGLWPVDAHLTLAWPGNGWWLDLEVVRQLRAWLGVAGATFRYAHPDDGDDMTVELLDVSLERDLGWPRNYIGTVELHVLAIDTYLGDIYLPA